MDKDLIGTPITLGEYERVTKNLKVCSQLTEEQYEWLRWYLGKFDYKLREVNLDIKDGILCVFVNIKNSVHTAIHTGDFAYEFKK